MKDLESISGRAKEASLRLAHLSPEVKNAALLQMASALENGADRILEANREDLAFAEKEGIAGPLVARLSLNENKIRGMAEGVRSVASLPDPVGQEQSVMEMDRNLILHRVSCPIGVIGAIFESRPDAVPQISSLCLKSGNAVILKGGTEAQNTNKVIVSLLVDALEKVGNVPGDAIQMIETRADVASMLKQDESIDLIVPRGSNQFVKYIQENTRIPVLGHADGICHGYLAEDADLNQAVPIIVDAKIQYAAACNALETLLVHESIAPQALPRLMEAFSKEGVELVGCRRCCSLVKGIKPAEEGDWDTEYNDMKLSIKLVSGLEEAIGHINRHGSGHTDMILTRDAGQAERFMNEVDSASVIWNASTRFADGFRYGLGAEIGISTNKTHARGPVGLDGLVIYKYKLLGSGQTVAQYSGENAQPFTHKPLPTA